MPRWILIVALLSPAACRDQGAVADNAGDVPPLEMVEAPSSDWSMLRHAIGRTPADSGVLTKGPIVTDLNALLGPDAIRYRALIEQKGGPLVRAGNLLVTVTPSGKNSGYLIIDPEQLALEAGFTRGGAWVVRRTPSSDVARPPAVEALLAS